MGNMETWADYVANEDLFLYACFWFESYDFVGDTTLTGFDGTNFTFSPWNQYYQSDDLLEN